MPIRRSMTASAIAFALALGLTAVIELGLGRSPLGPDVRFGWWDGDIWSSANSQRVADADSFSHVVHGILCARGASGRASASRRSWRWRWGVFSGCATT